MRVRLAILSLLVASFLAPIVAARPATAQTVDLDAARSTAWQLSVLESQSDWDALYEWMHPDSKAFVNRQTVAYWYATYFAPNGPNPAIINGARLVDWTWQVNGRTYANTAEVSFTQQFDNGSTVSDVVRLVQTSDGTWHWFFGRSFEFIQRIAQEAGQPLGNGTISESGNSAPALEFAQAIAAIDQVPVACFVAAGAGALPAAVGPNSIESRYPVSDVRGEGEIILYNRAVRRDFPELVVNVLTLASGETPESYVSDIVASQLDWNGPPYSAPPRALVDDLSPESAYLMTYYEEFSEPLGFVPVFVWGPRGGNTLFGVAGPAADLFDELIVAWSANARAFCSG